MVFLIMVLIEHSDSDKNKKKNKKNSIKYMKRQKWLELIVGFLAILIVIYRIVYFAVPLWKSAFQDCNTDWYKFFQAFTLLV